MAAAPPTRSPLSADTASATSAANDLGSFYFDTTTSSVDLASKKKQKLPSGAPNGSEGLRDTLGDAQPPAAAAGALLNLLLLKLPTSGEPRVHESTTAPEVAAVPIMSSKGHRRSSYPVPSTAAASLFRARSPSPDADVALGNAASATAAAADSAAIAATAADVSSSGAADQLAAAAVTTEPEGPPQSKRRRAALGPGADRSMDDAVVDSAAVSTRNSSSSDSSSSRGASATAGTAGATLAGKRGLLGDDRTTTTPSSSVSSGSLLPSHIASSSSSGRRGSAIGVDASSSSDGGGSNEQASAAAADSTAAAERAAAAVDDDEARISSAAHTDVSVASLKKGSRGRYFGTQFLDTIRCFRCAVSASSPFAIAVCHVTFAAAAAAAAGAKSVSCVSHSFLGQ